MKYLQSVSSELTSVQTVCSSEDVALAYHSATTQEPLLTTCCNTKIISNYMEKDSKEIQRSQNKDRKKIALINEY